MYFPLSKDNTTKYFPLSKDNTRTLIIFFKYLRQHKVQNQVIRCF